MVNRSKGGKIFYMVHCDIAVGTYAHTEVIMLSYPMIALQTRSSLIGAEYAQTAVTLDYVTMNGVITRYCTPNELPSDIPTVSPMVSLSEKSTVE